MPMKMKICPCCDQPIEGIYCKGCRKIVWKPVEQDIKYYLNTRHPAAEHDCTYHDDGERVSGSGNVRNSQHAMTFHEIEAKKAEIKARILQRKQEGPRDFGTIRKPSVSSTMTGAKTIKKAEANRNKMIAAVTAVIVTIMLLVTFVMIGVINSMNDALYGSWGEPVPEPLATAPALETPIVEIPSLDLDDYFNLPVPEETDSAEMEEWEMTDDEVRELGTACNGFGHFPMIFDDVNEVLFDCIRDAGYGWSMSAYSYNQFMDEYTWYETVYELTIRNADEYAGFLNIDVDTATGEIHGMELYTEYEKGFFEVADIVVKFLEKIGAAENLPDGTEFFETAYKNQGDAGVCLQNGLEVVCSIPDDEFDIYRMAIYAPGYYTIVE